eukprot:scaffold11242_cov61-Phaeocystis_antarctica.AAC.7
MARVVAARSKCGRGGCSACSRPWHGGPATLRLQAAALCECECGAAPAAAMPAAPGPPPPRRPAAAA